MLIDWFTVVAQIVNFLVLVALLRYFLYERIVRSIDEREKHITQRLSEAGMKNKEAEQAVELARARILEQERKAGEMMIHAQQEADSQRDQLVRKARESVRGLEAKWREDLDRERQAFLDELRRRAGAEILSVTRRALADLACAEVQTCAIQVFLEKLRSFDAGALRDLVGHELIVASALELPDETKREVRYVLENRLGGPVHLTFERTPAMSWGLELRGNGRRIGWNSATYIDSLEENLKEALEHQSSAGVLVGT